jgi:hypothetical protein
MARSCEGAEEDACSYGACFDCGPFGSRPLSQCVDGVRVEGHGDCQTVSRALGDDWWKSEGKARLQCAAGVAQPKALASPSPLSEA